MNSILSPLDERYRAVVEPIAKIFSQQNRYKAVIEVELAYLVALAEVAGVAVPKISGGDRAKLILIGKEFDNAGHKRVQAIDRRVNHEVKALEYFVGERLEALGLGMLKPWVHFGLTSEDVLNISQSMLLRAGSREILHKALAVQKILLDLVKAGKDVVMLGRTHGQPAVPTSMGKELLVYASQLQDLLDELSTTEYTGKLTGAAGTLAAHKAAYPEVNWLGFSEKFVKSFGLKPELVTAQILPTTSWVRLFSVLRRLSLLTGSLAQDLWQYVSLGYFKQMLIAREVGSSTMPQKVNPIQLENAEGNSQVAEALFSLLVRKFSHSRLQRDLSDSTVRLNFGVAYGHTYISLNSLLRGMGRLDLDLDAMQADLDQHGEVVAEGVQTILRVEGDQKAYEQAKKFFRGRKFEREEFTKWVKAQKISQRAKEQLVNLVSNDYSGFVSQIVNDNLPKLEKRVKKVAAKEHANGY